MAIIDRVPPDDVLRRKVLKTRIRTAVLTAAARLSSYRLRPCRVTDHRYAPGRWRTVQRIQPRSWRTFSGHRELPAPRTPVVFFHGGGLFCGQKELQTADLAFLAERGHVVFNADYPLAPDERFPAPQVAVLQCLAFVRELLERDGASPGDGPPEVFLAGDSSGGTLTTFVALLLADRLLLEDFNSGISGRENLGLLDLAYPRIAGVASLYGVLDRFSAIDDYPHGASTFVCHAGRGAVDEDVRRDNRFAPYDVGFASYPPLFLAAGEQDPLHKSASLFFEKADALEGDVQLKLYPRAHHLFFNMFWTDASKALRRDMMAFFDGRRVEGARQGGRPAGEAAAIATGSAA